MTKKNLITFLLIASYTVIAFFIGCIPEDSLQWSADGSKGIYSKNGALFIVDGNSGSLTEIAPKETTTLWPAISSDGRYIAYGEKVTVENLADAIKLLPLSQIRMLQTHAATVKESIRKKVDEESMFKQEVLGKGLFADDVLKSYNEEYRNWIVHYIFKKLDEGGTLAEKLGIEAVEKALLKEPLNYYRMILIQSDNLDKKTVITTSIQNIWKISFSPDSNLVAYVTNRIKGDVFEYGFDLYIASPAQQIPAAFVAGAVAIGYDFRPDGRAIAYIEPEKEDFEDHEMIIGSLAEKIIADANGKLIIEPIDPEKETTFATHKCTGPAQEFAGVLYYPWMFVDYALNGRIFFSTAKISLPSSKIDEERGSLFCYDFLTGAVSEILPQTAIDFTQVNFYLFASSQDCQKILLLGNKNTLGIYALGEGLELSKVLIDEKESFGDDSSKFVPKWKGRDQISCLVSEKSHYLTGDPNTPHRRKEIVILDTNGKLVQVLSKDWPDELLEY
ncbi:MAG: hypothetical protein JW947_00405 [Sedimentisphaerales bacterium]|nr:hypothetical protein [Sedimentisphaerales bacterium]